MSRVSILFAALSVSGSLGCSAAQEEDEVEDSQDMLTRVTDAELAAAQRQDISRFTFDRLTPTSTKIMRASHWWMGAQDEYDRYPRPRMCATNVSKVLFLSGVTSYDQEGVRSLVADVNVPGSIVAKLPQTKAAFLSTLDNVFGGRIPAGTFVAGMNKSSSAPGDQHIGFIGHDDADGTVWIYHNNWYRPENERGNRKPYMVSDENLRRGFMRQWMATPWVRIRRDAAGRAVDVTSLLPALDDMDPFNSQYEVTLAVPREIARELGDNQHSDGGALSCTVSDPDGFTHLRENDGSSRVLASVKAATSLRVIANEGQRKRVDLEGWVSATLTTCGQAASCGASEKVVDADPSTLGAASGTNLRAAADLSSALLAVVANDTLVDVLEKAGSRLRVRLRGTVGAAGCN